MSESRLRVTREGAVAFVELIGPGGKAVMDDQFFIDLASTTGELDADEAVRAIAARHAPLFYLPRLMEDTDETVRAAVSVLGRLAQVSLSRRIEILRSRADDGAAHGQRRDAPAP